MFFFFFFKVKSARNMYIKSEPWLSSTDIVYLEIKVSTYLQISLSPENKSHPFPTNAFHQT